MKNHSNFAVVKKQFYVSVSILLLFFSCSKMPTELTKVKESQKSELTAEQAILLSQETGSTQSCSVEDGYQSSGALYRIWMPCSWNGDLVVYAHGYISPKEPLRIPIDQLELPDGTSIPEIINQLGYAFAVSSFSKNGLAVKEGVVDLVDLVDIFTKKHCAPQYTYLVGASEGGLIAALGVEDYVSIFSGGLATCGPIGNFQKQLNYFGDFRVVFDCFFPGLIPGSPVEIPEEVMNNWASVYQPSILMAIANNPDATIQLLSVTDAAFNPLDPNSIGETILGILWYNIFATNDARQELHGQPFDNKLRIYRGSNNDILLNQNVQRFSADPSARAEIEKYYQTSGELTNPLVTVHTKLDPIVPFWHEHLYKLKVLSSGSNSNFTKIPIHRYGHCNFTVEEVLAAFALLVFKVTSQDLFAFEENITNENARQQFRALK